MAAGTVIYGISGDAVFRIRNTHGDLAPRPAAGPVLYGHSRAKSSFSAGTHNAIDETTPYVAKVTCFTIKIMAPAVGTHNTIEEATPYVAKMTRFTVNIYRNSQHYRESDVPCRQSAVFYHQNDRPEAPGGPPASHGGENRGQAPPK